MVQMSWLPRGCNELGAKEEYCSPAMGTFHDGTTVFLNAYVASRSWEFWVTHLGGEKQAQKYEVKIAVSHDRSPNSITFQGKLYGADTSKLQIDDEKDKEGVMELSKSLMKKLGTMENGELHIPMNFELVRK